MGILYIVSTPIGNIDDISIRAIKTLFMADAIACEDTRRTGMLLKLLKDKFKEFIPEQKQVSKQHLMSYYEHNESMRIPQIINALKNGLNVALVSDAGTPLVSDPGFKLVRECWEEKLKIEIIPGPTAAVSALVLSGLPSDKFIFIGYPPRKPGHRVSLFQNVYQALKFVKSTVVIYESPHKLKNTISDISKVFGDIEIVLIKEITKIHESRKIARISTFLEDFSDNELKGEYVIVFNNTDSLS